MMVGVIEVVVIEDHDCDVDVAAENPRDGVDGGAFGTRAKGHGICSFLQHASLHHMPEPLLEFSQRSRRQCKRMTRSCLVPTASGAIQKCDFVAPARRFFHFRTLPISDVLLIPVCLNTSLSLGSSYSRTQSGALLLQSSTLAKTRDPSAELRTLGVS